MRLRWVLLLSDRHAELYQLDKGNLRLQQQFEQTESGISAFATFLSQNPIKSQTYATNKKIMERLESLH